MIQTYNYEYCKKIAEVAHFHQVRKKSNEPYIVHPEFVANQMEIAYSNPVDPFISSRIQKLKCIAILHDVLEDSGFTDGMLRRIGVANDVIYVLGYLTHYDNVSYSDYIEQVIKNKYAVMVKIWDIRHNMLTCSPSAREERYLPALRRLEEVVDNLNYDYTNGDFKN